jgi:hypothetical protein
MLLQIECDAFLTVVQNANRQILRLHPTSPRWNASVSRNRSSLLGKKSTCPYCSSLIKTCSTIQVAGMSKTLSYRTHFSGENHRQTPRNGLVDYMTEQDETSKVSWSLMRPRMWFKPPSGLESMKMRLELKSVIRQRLPNILAYKNLARTPLAWHTIPSCNGRHPTPALATST